MEGLYQQIYYVANSLQFETMSYFQKMMKANQTLLWNKEEKSKKQSAQNSDDQKSEDASSQQQSSMRSNRNHKKEVRKKIPLRFQKFKDQQDQQRDEIAEEPTVQSVYKFPKVKLILSLLPAKDQLLLEMMAKKSKFEEKKLQFSNVCQVLRQSNKRFIDLNRNEENQKQRDMKKVKQKKIRLDESQKENTSRYKSSKKSDCQCVRHCLDSQQKGKTQELRQADFLNQNTSNSDFNKEIMLKLLSIIENERNDRSNILNMNSMLSMSNINQMKSSMMGQGHNQSAQKDHPIIINNIMKSPMDILNKQLIQKEMKIRMLESKRSYRNNNGDKRSYRSGKFQNIKLNKFDHKRQEYMEEIQDNYEDGDVVTQRSSSHAFQKYQLSDLSEKVKKAPRDKKYSEQKRSYQESQLRSESIDQNQPISGNQSKKQSINMIKNINNPQTQPNQQRQETHESAQKAKPSRERQFKKQRDAKNLPKETPPITPKIQQKKLETMMDENRSSNTTIEERPPTKLISKIEIVEQKIEVYKPPVKIQIPLDDKRQVGQNITLAEAFKRRIGRLKSQKIKDQKNERQKSLKQSIQYESLHNDEKIMITNHVGSKTIQKAGKNEQKGETKITLSNIVSCKMTQSVNESLPMSRRKAIRPSKILSENLAVKNQAQNLSSEKSLREPSKELIDRLIYGSKAVITKKQMYALTKKNYNNLPEVKAKQRQQNKKQMELERLNKIKEYQRHIRSSKSLKKE